MKKSYLISDSLNVHTYQLYEVDIFLIALKRMTTWENEKFKGGFNLVVYILGNSVYTKQ
jgi:hypothetical protein